MGHLLTVAKMRFLGQEIRNTFWWGGNDATHTNAQVLIDEIADAYRDELVPQLVNTWSLYAFDVYDKTVAASPGIEYQPAGAAIVGASASHPMATQVAGLLTLKAAVPAPNTNRKFIGGFPEDQMNPDGRFHPAIITAIEDFAQRLLDLPTATALAVVIEVVELSAVDQTVVAGNPLTYYRVSDIPSALRRRKIGVGI